MLKPFKLLDKLVLKFHHCDNNYKFYSSTKIGGELVEVEFRCAICDKIIKFDVKGWTLFDIQKLYVDTVKPEPSTKRKYYE